MFDLIIETEVNEICEPVIGDIARGDNLLFQEGQSGIPVDHRHAFVVWCKNARKKNPPGRGHNYEKDPRLGKIKDEKRKQVQEKKPCRKDDQLACYAAVK